MWPLVTSRDATGAAESSHRGQPYPLADILHMSLASPEGYTLSCCIEILADAYCFSVKTSSQVDWRFVPSFKMHPPRLFPKIVSSMCEFEFLNARIQSNLKSLRLEIHELLLHNVLESCKNWLWRLLDYHVLFQAYPELIRAVDTFIGFKHKMGDQSYADRFRAKSVNIVFQ